MSEIHEGSELVRNARGEISRRDDGMYDGAVHTPHGTIGVSGYAEPGRLQTIRLQTVRDGRIYYRWERREGRRTLADRGLKVLAHRWARDLAERLDRSEGDGE